MLKNKLLSAMGGSEPTDPNFANTVLLLHGDGTNGAQNNTFLDSSTNNFTITRNGNTTQGTFSPYGNLWSNYFDGDADKLSVASNASFVMGTGDFTVEAWCYQRDKIDPYPRLIHFGPYWNSKDSWGINPRDNEVPTKISLASFKLGGRILVSSSDFAFNTWNHVVVTRSSGVFRLFVNGKLEAVNSSFIGTSIESSSTNSVCIGGAIDRIEEEDFFGYISNVRIIKGSVPTDYQTSSTTVGATIFSSPTAPLTAVSGTSLLTCQSNRFIDNSSNNFTISTAGSPSVQRFSPFAPSAAYSAATIGGSGYFDGSGDYLQSTSGGFALGSGSFTAECWFYATELTSGNYYALMGSGWQTSGGWYFAARTTGIYVFFQPSGFSQEFSATVVANSWNHVALVRNGSSLTVYLNGISLASQSASGNLTAAPGAIGVSDYSAGSGYSYFFKGFIADARTVVGTALYTSNFTPPTAPLTPVTNTRLLLNFTNAGIYDNTGMNSLETVGNAQISTSVKKFGTGAMYFDGSADYLLAPNSQNIEFGGGDFTIEFWIYRVGSSVCYPIEKRSPSAVSGYSVILFNGTQAGFVASFDDATWGVNISDSNALPQNTWAHVAITRSGNVWRLFVDGAQRASTTTAGAITNNAAPVSIGAQSNGSSSLNGYIDDLRITKGVARYTANFTPPARAFPNK